MVEIIDKVKEKAKHVKDKVVDNTKDIIDETKDSISSTLHSSSSSPSIAYFHSPESKYQEKSNSDIEIKKVDSPLTEHGKSELLIPSANIKENESTATGYAVTTNQINKQYNYKENNEFFNPFSISIKLW